MEPANTGVPKQEDFDPKKTYPYHQQRFKDGGIHMSYINDASLSAAIVQVVKNLSSKLLKGEIKNVMALSKPTKISTHYSFAEVIAMDGINTHFLDYAASPFCDPIRKMQFVIAHMMSGYHFPSTKIYNLVPLDPQLGETVVLKKKNGTTFTCECTQAQPPGCLVHLVGPNKSWELSYYHQVSAHVVLPSLNSLIGDNDKNRIYKFSDGTVIEAENVVMQIDGLVMGERVMNLVRSFRVMCEKHRLLAEVKMSTDDRGKIKKAAKKFMNFFSFSGKEEQRDKGDFDVQIYKYNKFPEVKRKSAQTEKSTSSNMSDSASGDEEDEDVRALVSEGSGNWTQYIQFDKKLLWRATDAVEDWVPDVNNFLPSDVNFRPEKQLMVIKDYDTAERVKNQAEDQQTKDAGLRKAYQKNQGKK